MKIYHIQILRCLLSLTNIKHVYIRADTSNNSSIDTSDDNNQGWESDRSNTSYWSFLQLPPDVREAPIKLFLTLYNIRAQYSQMLLHSYYSPTRSCCIYLLLALYYISARWTVTVCYTYRTSWFSKLDLCLYICMYKPKHMLLDSCQVLYN
jgi:hypothetical protein